MMNMKTYNKIIDDLKLMVDSIPRKPLQISLYKDSEPADKNLVEMVKILKKQKSLIVLVTTNGSALTEKKSRELIEAGLDRIRFSIEHVNDEGYEKIIQKNVI